MPLEPNAAVPWLALADADLTICAFVVHNSVATRELLGLACFHAQQAAEKAVKGLLAAHDLAQPRTHDIVLLLQTLARVMEIPAEVINACEALADYGVGPRYPTPQLAADADLAARAWADARTVVGWTRIGLGIGSGA
jgi:HEPN domain-containing protein